MLKESSLFLLTPRDFINAVFVQSHYSGTRFATVSFRDEICVEAIYFLYILKMLCLYLYTLRIGHKSGNMLSILNKLKLQKELQTFFDK